MRDWRQCIEARIAGTRPQHAREHWLIPGLTLEQSRPYLERFPANPAPAAVLIPLVEREAGLTVLLTERAAALRNHAGQVSFPGGRMERGETPVQAALREAQEEIGLDPGFVTPLGFLPDHIVISGFRVTPVVAFVRPGFKLTLDPLEVQDAFEVPLTHVFEPANHLTRRRKLPWTDGEIDICDIPYSGRNIWGATAGILLTLYRLCQGIQ